jgi:hypothetical protein
LNSETVAIGPDFSTADVPVPPDLLLFVLLLSFSPFPAMTKSVLFSSLRCLRLMQNQKAAKDASRTTTMGTTMAGTRVLMLEEDLEEAAVEDADGALDDFGEEGEVAWASEAVRAAYWEGSVMVEVT